MNTVFLDNNACQVMTFIHQLHTSLVLYLTVNICVHVAYITHLHQKRHFQW